MYSSVEEGGVGNAYLFAYIAEYITCVRKSIKGWEHREGKSAILQARRHLLTKLLQLPLGLVDRDVGDLFPLLDVLALLLGESLQPQLHLHEVQLCGAADLHQPGLLSPLAVDIGLLPAVGRAAVEQEAAQLQEGGIEPTVPAVVPAVLSSGAQEEAGQAGEE